MPSKKRKIASEDATEGPSHKRRFRSSGPSPEPVPNTQEASHKHHLRSSGPLAATQPDVLAAVRRKLGSQKIGPPRKSRRHNRENDSPSLEQKPVKDTEDEDELLLSPSKTRSSQRDTPPRTRTPRLFLHSVEIATPSRRSMRVHEPASPTQVSKRCKMKPANDKLSTPLGQQNALKIPLTHSPLKPTRGIHSSPSRLPRKLPEHLHSCLYAQKRAILRALQDPQGFQADEDTDDDVPTNDIAFQQLCELLNGTVTRGEGNSCLLIGPRGSGKTRLIARCLKGLTEQPIVIRLSGWAQSNDRLAMREIAWQLAQQTGSSFLSSEDDDNIGRDENENPFLDVGRTVSIPSSSHLPALISVLPTLSQPTVVILDGFDLFALHARQSLLYCLLDTAQSCQVGLGNKGIAIIGVTSRVDTINLLEKRVKSRFSGRVLRTAIPRSLMDWTAIARNALCAPVEDELPEWKQVWHAGVDDFLADPKVVDAMNDTFALAGDVRMLSRIMMCPVLQLGPSSPFPSASTFASGVIAQRCRPRFSYLHSLPYPSICLLIAAMHAQTAGSDIITFEMLHECFRDQVKSSTSAPVQVQGGGIGMMRCSREVLMSAFEQLESVKVFVPVTASSENVSKEFIRYRCVAEREDVKNAVERIGQTNLKKWLSKAQSLMHT